MICARCAELEERVAALNEQIRKEHADDLKASLQSDLGVTPQQLDILLLLKSVEGRVLSTSAIADRVPNAFRRAIRDPNQISVQICRIRKRLGADVIQNVWGAGFRLTPLGDRVISEAIEWAEGRKAVPHVA